MYGEQPLAEDENWGYGPPRYLTVEQVRIAAEALTATGFEDQFAALLPVRERD